MLFYRDDKRNCVFQVRDQSRPDGAAVGRISYLTVPLHCPDPCSLCSCIPLIPTACCLCSECRWLDFLCFVIQDKLIRLEVNIHLHFHSCIQCTEVAEPLVLEWLLFSVLTYILIEWNEIHYMTVVFTHTSHKSVWLNNMAVFICMKTELINLLPYCTYSPHNHYLSLFPLSRRLWARGFTAAKMHCEQYQNEVRVKKVWHNGGNSRVNTH